MNIKETKINQLINYNTEQLGNEGRNDYRNEGLAINNMGANISNNQEDKNGNLYYSDTNTANVIWMWVGLIGAILCFFGFALKDHAFWGGITALACIIFGI